MCLASNRFFVMKFVFCCCCCSCFFGVHVFLSTTRGKLLTSRDVARYATTRRQCRRTCASILFFYSAILCSWSVSFPFLFKTKNNGTDSFLFFASVLDYPTGSAGGPSGPLWDSFDTTLVDLPTTTICIIYLPGCCCTWHLFELRLDHFLCM